MAAMRTPEDLARMFRDRGLKVTPQRQCIFRVLHDDHAHPTAESVYEAARAQMPTMSLKTVYATLNDLAAMGEIQQLDFGTGASRFDPNVDAHHHLVCTSCGRVRDLYADYGSVRVPRSQLQGFVIGNAEVVFRGLCGTCATDKQHPSDRKREATRG